MWRFVWAQGTLVSPAYLPTYLPTYLSISLSLSPSLPLMHAYPSLLMPVKA